MTKLSDTQLVVLSAAAQRNDHSVLPLPASLRGGASAKVAGALLKRELITEVPAQADAPVWATRDDGSWTTLRITPAGLDALGITDDVAPEPAEAEKPAAKPKVKGRITAKHAAKVAAPAKARSGTKQEQVVEMLKRKEGATIAQISDATEWQAHTVRGFFAGALKKKLGLAVSSEKVDGVRVYRLT